MIASVVAITTYVGGCAASPGIGEKIEIARAQIERARQAGAADSAPVELATSSDKLARAEQAAAIHDAKPATVLAEQANVDAQLAEAIAQQQHSHEIAVELEASIVASRPDPLRSSAPAAH